MSITSFRNEYFFLSNFYPVEIKTATTTFPTVEHAFQGMKTLDLTIRQKIANCQTAKEAKQLGRRIKLRDDWEAVKVEIMYQLLKQKFSNPELAEQLKATGDKELIEGNTWNDTFWGVCKGTGQNMLGKLLMRVRSEL